MSDRKPVMIFIEMDSDETHRIMEFQTFGRSTTLPFGAVWVATGEWEREPTDANIFAEVERACPPMGSVHRRGKLVTQAGVSLWVQDEGSDLPLLRVPLPQPVRYVRIKREDLPTDRTYRDALIHDGTALTFDMEKARAIHLTHLREVRTAELGKLDIAFTRAMGKGHTEEATRMEAQRQALRDAPQTLPVDEAQTVEELKTLWPSELPPWGA